MALLIAAAVTCALAWMILSGFKAQATLLLGGTALMAVAVLMNGAEILPAQSSTGSVWLDVFEWLKQALGKTTAGLGLMIMSVAGFARYMESIGASAALVGLVVKPLQRIRSPYLVLGAAYVLGQILALFIPSASGLGVLLMTTVFPVLVGLGVSRLSAAAAIATTSSLEIGPASMVTLTAAQYSGIDALSYFTEYQLPVVLCVVLTVAVLHAIVQLVFDRRAAANEAVDAPADLVVAAADAPRLYALLPIVPMLLILACSKMAFSAFRMEVMTAMLISIALAMLCEYVRWRDAKRVFADLQAFFDGMGVQFASVVTLIVAGQMFAEGLVKLGAIDQLILIAQDAAVSGWVMVIAMAAVIALAAVIMGSGNAPFFAFASLAPTLAVQMGMSPVQMLLPMQFSSSIARCVSPITAVVVVVAGMAKVSPMALIRRTAIPMAGAMLVNLLATMALIR